MLERLKDVFQTAERGAGVRRAPGSGAHGVGRRQPRRAGRAGARRLLRQVRRALGRAVRRLRRRDRSTATTEWGQQGRPRRARRAARRARRASRSSSRRFSETSTGVVNDVRELTEVAHRHGALIVGRRRVRPRRRAAARRTSGASTWSSPARRRRSCAPPGLGFASANQARARAAPPPRPGRPLLLRLGAHRRRASARTRRTARSRRPSASHGARRRARDDRGRGPRAGLRAPRLLGRATRAAVKRARPRAASAPEDENANVVTAITPARTSIDGAKVPKLMRDHYGVTIAGGQGQLKGKIARIAHCGYFGAFDIVITRRRARDDAARAGPRGRARRRRGRGPARLPRGGRAGRRAA